MRAVRSAEAKKKDLSDEGIQYAILKNTYQPSPP